VEVDYDVGVPADPGIEVAELFNLTITEIAQRGGRSVEVRTETYPNLTMRPGARREAIPVVNEASKMVQLSRDAGFPDLPDPFTPTLPAATGTVGSALPVPPPAAPVVADGSTFNVSVAGAPAVTCTIDLGGDSPPDYPRLRPYVEAAIRAAGMTAANPYLAGATVQLWGRGTTAAPYRFVVQAGRGASPFDPTTTLAFSGGIATTGLRLGGAAVTPRAQQFELTSGGNGIPPGAGSIVGVRANKTGLFALEEADLFNLLCIPRAAEIGATDQNAMTAILSEAETYCQERRAFFLVDIPPDVTEPGDMQAWMSLNDTLRHRNAAVYFPRPLIPDPLNEFRLRSMGPSGTMAGVYAATDAARGVWKAPAGTEARLRGVQALEHVLTDNENGLLNPIGINALRTFPIFGSVAWGARTLDGSDQQASEWKYIPVRRLALYIEESLFRGTKWVVFEPNDEPLWAQIRLNVGAFMNILFRQGAFQGRTPQEAYFVKCDKETTTQEDIDRGVVNILVGFAPLKPAEFVIIQIQQKAQLAT
jgi:hypothetical protein